MRKTKIVATVGPACGDNRLLKTLIHEGVDVFRVNASHTNPKSLGMWVKKIRRAAHEAGKSVAVLVDLQGPRVRTGTLASSTLRLREGERVKMLIGKSASGEGVIATPTREFTRMVKAGDPILLDNGLLKLKALQVLKKAVLCRVVQGGILGENKGINLPNAPVTLDALTPKDRADLDAAIRNQADFIALSFVRSADDVEAVKNWMRRKRRDIPVIAKIEKPKAVDGLESILAKADGIMVARGDLGIEMGVEKVPSVQKMLIENAIRSKVPVITATQMLETMMDKPNPTRAEVSDIANAVFDGTDAVMLSGETAIGKYPVEAVRTMRKIIEEAERTRSLHPEEEETKPDRATVNLRATTQAALYAARELDAKAIFVFTRSGKTAQYASKLNPKCPVIAVCTEEKTMARLNLLRGVKPVHVPQLRSTEAMIHAADKAALKAKILKKGDAVVVVYGKQALPGILYTIAVHYLGKPW